MNLRACLRFGSVLLAAATAMAPNAALAAGTPAQRFATVTEWHGEFTVEESGSYNHSGDRAPVDMGTVEVSSRGRFTLRRVSDRRWDPARGIFEWMGDGTAETKVRGSRQRREWTSGDETSLAVESAGTVPLRQVSVKISLKDGYSTLHWGGGDTSLPVIRTGHAIAHHYDAEAGRQVAETISLDETNPRGSGLTLPNLSRLEGRTVSLIDWFPQVAGGPGVVSIAAALPGSGYGLIGNPSGDKTQHRATVLLYPVYDEFECELKIGGYEDWRPEGSIEKPDQAGNHLVVTATLKPKNEASARNLPEVRRFVFHLGEVSREPGVCLNWPLAAKDNNPDLRLALAGVPGELSEEDQELTIAHPLENDAGQPYATAQIDAFDFGARGHLIVTCELSDGRELVGVLRTSDGDRGLVNLPKQQQCAWIADAWTKAHGTGDLPSNDDDEKVDGQPDNGDGYTLYEEYRGFAVNGKHVEGDPKRKDYFVLNLIGADARPAIDLFEELSSLRVHSKLRRSEMSQKERLMNGNHRDAPHRVDQHGVWVKTFTIKGLGGFGAYTPLKKAHVAGRPGITIGIGLLARDEPWSDFNRATGKDEFSQDGYSAIQISARDAAFAYDGAIAHELLHSVGVEHHGEGNYVREFQFVHANDPDNPYRRACYARWQPEMTVYMGGTVGVRTAGPLISLVEEGSGRNLAETAAAQFEPEFAVEWSRRQTSLLEWAEKFAAAHPEMKRTPRYWAERKFYDSMSLRGWLGLQIGIEHGEDSGADDCVMRYYFAKAYPVKGSDSDFIFIPPETNVVGLGMCTSPKGTGVNSALHRPQSRHGDAAPGDGNCRGQICPNDAIPLRKTR